MAFLILSTRSATSAIFLMPVPIRVSRPFSRVDTTALSGFFALCTTWDSGSHAESGRRPDTARVGAEFTAGPVAVVLMGNVSTGLVGLVLKLRTFDIASVLTKLTG